ncbi:MAG TPA: hypothetical protein VJ124_22240 [Pyrinomonadaceae bacterium]|nr:hypothetical protein [Pyrinomonadaceae bacterium]
MTPLAVLETEITTKGALAIMAAHAARPAPGRKMLGGTRRTHLSVLRRACSQIVTASAIQTLARPMFGMAEACAIRAGVQRRANKRLLVVANAARGDLSPC